MGDRPVVLVLAGGGSRAAMEVGVLRVLGEHGFAPDHVVGTSAGALNATMVAALPLGEAVERLVNLWDSPEARAVFRASPREMIRNLAARNTWLRGNQPLHNLVSTALTDLRVRRFDELRLPLSVLVTDFAVGSSQAITDGLLQDTLVASCSVPGVFPPVVIRGRSYVDGGVLENCSISTAMALEPRQVVVIDVSAVGALEAAPSWLEVVDRTMGLAQHARLLADLNVYASMTSIAVLSPCPSRHIGLLEPVNAARLVELTAAAMRAMSSTIFAEGQVPAPDIHEFAVDLTELGVPSAAQVPTTPAARNDVAARAARWSRALVRARRERGWIEVPPHTAADESVGDT
jgi:NTE family protein